MNILNFNKFKKKNFILLSKILFGISEHVRKIKYKKLYVILIHIILKENVDERTIINHKDSVKCLLKLNNNKIASGSLDKAIKIFNLLTGECLFHLIGHTETIISLLKLNKNLIASGSYDNSIKLWI